MGEEQKSEVNAEQSSHRVRVANAGNNLCNGWYRCVNVSEGPPANLDNHHWSPVTECKCHTLGYSRMNCSCFWRQEAGPHWYQHEERPDFAIFRYMNRWRLSSSQGRHYRTGSWAHPPSCPVHNDCNSCPPNGGWRSCEDNT